MQYLKLFFTRNHLRDRLFTRTTAETFFGFLGSYWLVFRIISFFEPSIQDSFLGQGRGFVLVLVFFAFLTLGIRRPKIRLQGKVEGRDILVRIVVGDLLKMNSSCVIGVYNTFDTDTRIVNRAGLQARFTKKHYESLEDLDSELETGLSVVSDSEDLATQGDRRGKTKKFPLGTVVPITQSRRRYYFLAIADVASDGTFVSNEEMLRTSLDGLWQHMKQSGDHEKELLVPVLGTGAGFPIQTREIVIQEIIGSFIAASAQQKICEKFTIVINPTDFYQFDIRMEDLGHFVTSQCKYWKIGRNVDGSA